MPIQITHWLRAFLAIQEAAFDGRGETTILDGNEVVDRWPRTTGDDAVAIAAVIDPIVKAIANVAISKFWRPLAEDLAHHAIADAVAVYSRNEKFWKELLVSCVELHAANIGLPPHEQLDALLARLRAMPFRNASVPDGPFKHFDGIKSLDELYNAQFVYLRDLRGFDLVDPEVGMRGDNRPIPRTTNADVLALAEFWDKQFAGARSVAGKREAIASMWTTVFADASVLAHNVDPTALYPKNNGFWRAMKEVAIYIAVADETPTNWDLAKEALKDSITHLPENIASAVGSAAHEVGKVAGEAGKGLFSGFGTPLLVAGAGLVGLYLVMRRRPSSEAV